MKQTLRFLTFFCVFLAFQQASSQVSLTGTSYTQNFDAIGSGLPSGWSVYTPATATALGTASTLTTAQTSWGTTTGNFRNVASADGSASGDAVATQNANTDRSLAVRQTGSFGDPGASFAFQITNTTGFQDFNVSVKLQSLDVASARTTGWALQYGIGTAPTSFTNIATGTAGGTSFTNTTLSGTLPLAVNNQSQPVWIRLVALNASTGSGSRATSGIDDFSLTYTAATSTPVLAVSPSTLSNLNYTEGNGPSSGIASTTITGNNLTANVTVTPPANFEISVDGGATYSTSPLSITPTSGSVSQTVQARLVAGLTAGPYSGNISVTSTGATAQSVALSGAVSAPGTSTCGAASAINTVRAGIPALNTYAGASVTITGRITGIFGANKFYIQDATGGLAIFDNSPAVVTTNGLAVGDEVYVTGSTARFNGEAQLANVTCIDKKGAGTPPAPVVYDPAVETIQSFLATNEGKLVTMPSVNITGSGTFSASTNYAAAGCAGGSTEIRIDAAGTTNIAGTTIPSSTQAITGVVGHFINSTETVDKLQVFPRTTADFAAAATTCTPVVSACGVATVANAETTLDVSNINLEWLGNTTNGPTNEALQLSNSQTLLNGMGSDVFMLQEITSYNATTPTDPSTSFGALIQGLNSTFPSRAYTGECSPRYSYSHQPQLAAGATPDPQGQRLCIIYRSDQITKTSSSAMTQLAYATNAWASGRYPFMFEANVTINGYTKPMKFLNVHGKAGSDVASYNRRVTDYQGLYDELNTNYNTANIVFGGDFNDDADRSITGSNQISSWKPFLYANPTETNIAGTQPNANWTPITKALSDAGCSSSAGYPDFIDHQIVSNEITSGISGIRYLPGSMNTLRPTIANYASTTSDHYPTNVRYEFFGPLPVAFLDFRGEAASANSVNLTWQTASEQNNDRFEVERSSDASTFERIGSVAGKGTSTQRNDYVFMDENAFGETVYYRLKQVDTDGQFEYSRTISVALGEGKTLVYPNPASDKFSVRGNIANLTLTDTFGRMLKEVSTNEMNISEFTAGYYFILATDNSGKVHRLKIIKR